MTFAPGSHRRVAYVPEVDQGITPDNPAFKLLRITGGSLRTRKGIAVSNEVRSDRNIADVLMVSQDVIGTYDFEFASGTAIDDMLQGALRSTWATNILKNGAASRFYTFEERSRADVYTYSRFIGSSLNSLSLNIASRQIVTGSMSLMGRRELLASSMFAGATYDPIETTQPATASSNVGSLSVAGVTTPLRMKSVQFTIDNGLRIRDEVGSLYSREFGAGPCTITGTVEAYFEANDQYQAVLSHDQTTISLTLGVENNNKYGLLFPKVRFLDGERRPGGNTDDYMLSLPFQAIYDPTELASIKVTRGLA